MPTTTTSTSTSTTTAGAGRYYVQECTGGPAYTIEKFDAPTPTLNSVYRIVSAGQPTIFDGVKCWIYTGISTDSVFTTGTWGTPFFNCEACNSTTTTSTTSTSTTSTTSTSTTSTSTSTTTAAPTTTTSTSTSSTTTTTAGFSYYIVKECGTLTEYEVAASSGTISIGAAYKLFSVVEPRYDGIRCWYIDRVGVTQTGPLVTAGTYYPDCAGCLAATTTSSTSTSSTSTSTSSTTTTTNP
jgi:hypothetical protein